MTYDFDIHNIKVSFKLSPSVTLEDVNNRCVLLKIPCKIVGNLASLRFRKHSFILFKRCQIRSKEDENHINIANCKNEDDILSAINDFYDLIGRSAVLTKYTIDNYSCTSALGKRIDLESFYVNNSHIPCLLNRERFPGLFLRSPKNHSLLAIVYKKGTLVIVGSRDLDEIAVFLNWIKSIFI